MKLEIKKWIENIQTATYNDASSAPIRQHSMIYASVTNVS